ncbi:MAG: arylsulfatase [Planctomycetales bacterium]|nr:arylsulfatase [Planctomycetales bacterium]
MLAIARNSSIRFLGLLTIAAMILPTACAQARQPNIVFILADDMGFGDVQALNGDSRIPTPHIDSLARDGMTFTDAHTPSSVCTPTRYGTLTGRYCWRTRLKRGVLGGYSAPLIDADRRTVATMLAANGYVTGAVGKWHLGMNMTSRQGNTVDDRWDGDGGVDFRKPIADGPTTRGFGYYFGVSASLDMAPYVWIENDHFASLPTKQFPGQSFPAFARKGPQADDLRFSEALDDLVEKARDFIRANAQGERPFFLYLPLTGPHKPVAPHERFVGATELGPYGDFVVNVDNAVGRVLSVIDIAGISDETLVFFTSDNGSYMYRLDQADARDHVDDPAQQAFRADRHRSNGPFRGTKADIWEAGHHVPFFARWHGQIAAGSRCDATICLTDLFATAADLVGAKVADDEAEDSFSIAPLLRGKEMQPPRAPVIHHSAGGMFAIREGQWKLVAGNGSGGRQSPKGKPFARPYHLYDLTADLGETTNLIDKHADVAKHLEAKLEAIRTGGRSR